MPLLVPLTVSEPDDLVAVWNAAVDPSYPINQRFLAYNLHPASGEILAGRLAIQQGEPVGFVLACAVSGGRLGWISALAVHPAVQRQGLGSQLLTWAEGWLREQGVKRIRLGGNLRPFAPGLPNPLGQPGQSAESFFLKRGYQPSADQPYEYDLARDLTDYQPLYSRPAQTELLPMLPGQEPALLEFLAREYPGRWEFEACEFVKNGGRPTDFLLLWVDGAVQGFCRTTLVDSERPLERFYPQRLPQPWGQFGPLGLSKAARGQGLGGYLIDAAALHLQALGVRGCIIDWTALVNLYEKFGFKLYNQYASFFKIISD